MRHISGYWNAIWSDMFIESTFMIYGHGKKGIISVTLLKTRNTKHLGIESPYL